MSKYEGQLAQLRRWIEQYAEAEPDCWETAIATSLMHSEKSDVREFGKQLVLDRMTSELSQVSTGIEELILSSRNPEQFAAGFIQKKGLPRVSYR